MASLPEKSMRNVLMIRVQIINNNIGITLMTGSKHNNLEIFTQLSQTLHSIGSNIDTGLDFRIIRERYLKSYIMRFF